MIFGRLPARHYLDLGLRNFSGKKLWLTQMNQLRKIMLLLHFTCSLVAHYHFTYPHRERVRWGTWGYPNWLKKIFLLPIKVFNQYVAHAFDYNDVFN